MYYYCYFSSVLYIPFIHDLLEATSHRFLGYIGDFRCDSVTNLRYVEQHNVSKRVSRRSTKRVSGVCSSFWTPACFPLPNSNSAEHEVETSAGAVTVLLCSLSKPSHIPFSSTVLVNARRTGIASEVDCVCRAPTSKSQSPSIFFLLYFLFGFSGFEPCHR